jgi:hypothetical protein
MAGTNRKRPSAAVAHMLRERDIALWEAHHYNFQTGRPTAKDPLSACLVTPRILGRYFHGHGPTIDEAIMDAINRNPELRAAEDGLLGAMARLESALWGLSKAVWTENIERRGEDYDVPF